MEIGKWELGIANWKLVTSTGTGTRTGFLLVLFNNHRRIMSTKSKSITQRRTSTTLSPLLTGI